MVSFSVADLFQYGVVSKAVTVRRRAVGSNNPPSPAVDEQYGPKMVPKISADGEGMDVLEECEKPHNRDVVGESTEEKNELFSESHTASTNDQRTILYVKGTHSINGGLQTFTCDQLEPLLQEEEEDDEFKTEVSGTSEAQESSFGIALQVFFPFLIAGFGTVCAGLLLDLVQVSK